MITALIAQGYSSEEAAIIGVFKHGEAGDMAVTGKRTNGNAPK
jgi:NAD(P)H-hydrate repair Nnr-like enzyme with NAD(P)H-hydrate dehydratase domain